MILRGELHLRLTMSLKQTMGRTGSRFPGPIPTAEHCQFCAQVLPVSDSRDGQHGGKHCAGVKADWELSWEA